MPAQRRFRPPWKVEEHDESFVVTDADGTTLAYLYYADEKRGGYHHKIKLTKDEARRIAAGIARLPDLIRLERLVKSGDLMLPPQDE